MKSDLNRSLGICMRDPAGAHNFRESEEQLTPGSAETYKIITCGNCGVIYPAGPKMNTSKKPPSTLGALYMAAIQESICCKAPDQKHNFILLGERLPTQTGTYFQTERCSYCGQTITTEAEVIRIVNG